MISFLYDSRSESLSTTECNLSRKVGRKMDHVFEVEQFLEMQTKF